MKRNLFLGVMVIALAAVLAGVAGCSNMELKKGWGENLEKEVQDEGLVIGLCMDTLQEERWQRDRDLFIEKAQELGAEVKVTEAAGDDELQNKQADNLISQGVDILVVVPHNGVTAAKIVEKAHKEGIKVVAYDRLINNSKPDLYISFDNVKVGYFQGKYLLDHKPVGNYVLIGGAPTDYNAVLFSKGQMKALQPAIDSGDIKIVFDDWAEDWKPENARRLVENALTVNNDKVDAVVVSNDGTAGGAVQALKSRNLDGVVLVSGQDADLAACQRIVEGTQTMTVYKPIRRLARKAAEIAVAMAKGEDISGQVNDNVSNGTADIPSVLIEPVQVDKSNMVETVIADGYQPFDEVYRNVPGEDRPPKPE